MRQVLLAPEPKEEEVKGHGKGNGKGNGHGNGGGTGGRVHSPLRHYANRVVFPPTLAPRTRRSIPKPLVMWMNDDAQIGDHFVWHGVTYVVSAVYGTHLSVSAICRKCDRPKRQSDQGNGIAVPIDR